MNVEMRPCNCNEYLRFAAVATESLAVESANGRWWTGSKNMKDSQTYTKTYAYVEACLKHLLFADVLFSLDGNLSS